MSGNYFNQSLTSLRDATGSSGSPTNNPGPARNTALSNKLTSVLSASYADSEIRDALGLLDLRGVENTAETRRRLRLDAQKEVIDCNAAVVQDFGKVAEQLKRIGTMITTLNRTCDDMRKHITVARQESAPMLEEASTLLHQKEEVEAKQQVLTVFSKHFILSEEESATLTSVTEPLDDNFFQTLGKAKKIHEDCEVLLEHENQRLGLELMDQTSRSINAAYKKLYNWVQKEFKTLDLEDPQISRSVRKALRVLAERPSLFQSCLDFFAEARENNLSHAFNAALMNPTGTSNMVPDAKPIEFSTHDTQRYVGDMLAWVHSAAVSEREALEGLFIAEGDELAKGIKSGQRSEPWSRLGREAADGTDEAVIDDNVAFDGRAALASLISRNLTGIMRTLKQRVEYAIRGNDDPVIVYKTLNLITFYLDTFTKLVGTESNAPETIKELQEFAFSHFEQLMADEVTEASNEAALPSDLSAPQFLLNALDRLLVFLKANSASTFSTEPSSSTSPTSLTRLLSVALTPFLDLCSELTASLPDPDISNTTTGQPPDPSSPIFQINYLLLVQSTLKPHLSSSLPTSLSTTLTTKISHLTSLLTSLQHTYLLATSHLSQLLSSLPSSTTVPLPPTFQPSSLSTSASLLDSFLPTALMDAIDHIGLLTDKTLARNLTESAVDLFVADFERVVGILEEWDREHGLDMEDGNDDMEEGVVEDEEGKKEVKEESLRAVYPRRVDEVRVLLS